MEGVGQKTENSTKNKCHMFMYFINYFVSCENLNTCAIFSCSAVCHNTDDLCN